MVAASTVDIKEIQVRVINIYGVEKVYPMCQTAQFFARLAGTKTLTNDAISQIKKAGYKVRVAQTVTEL